MSNLKKRLVGVSTSIFLLSFSSLVLAGTSGGQLIYGSGLAPSSIPTMSGLMLVVLALILATVAFRVLRKNGKQYLSVGILGLAALFSGYSGTALISQAHASSATYLMGSPSGGTIEFSPDWLNIFENTSGNQLQIISFSFNEGMCTNFPNGGEYVEGPECYPGLGIAAGDSCVIDCGQASE